MRIKIGFLASHNGSCARAIAEAIQAGRLEAGSGVLISNNSKSGALTWARALGLPAYHLSDRTHPGPGELDAAICRTLHAHGVNLLVLSGYMKKLGPATLAAYQHHILNTHPALLPKFGGQGMYGAHVHAAVLAAGETVSGITIHHVDEVYDHGATLAQAEVPVLPDDTVDTLQARVQAREKTFFVEILQRIAAGELPLV